MRWKIPTIDVKWFCGYVRLQAKQLQSQAVQPPEGISAEVFNRHVRKQIVRMRKAAGTLRTEANRLEREIAKLGCGEGD